jgi:signal transduction histidine kinase
MKKVALVFGLAVFVPSLVLAVLALRSLRDQQFVIERQQTLLYQGVADGLARQVMEQLASVQHSFSAQVLSFLQTTNAREAATSFDATLRQKWPFADVGFVVAMEGEILAPSLFGNPQARQFRLENDRFLCSREAVEVYWNSANASPNAALNQVKQEKGPAAPEKKLAVPDAGAESKTEADAMAKAKMQRAVVPTKESQPDASTSKFAPEEAEFCRLVGDAAEGTLARFLQDQLKVLVWCRAPNDPQLVFGAQLNLARLTDNLKELVTVEPALRREIGVALIDDAGRPVTVSPPDFQPVPMNAGLSPAPSKVGRPELNGSVAMKAPDQPPRLPDHSQTEQSSVRTAAAFDASGKSPPRTLRPDWKHPFVATEIGEALPHWEVAVYLLDPARLNQTARTLRLTLGLLIVLLLLAIGVGGWLIVVDLKRQLTLARQKTDFVSNVSHELKTPLTSIRMFSELLAEGRVQEESKKRHYLNIIAAEAARLTRLINNVLDFARLERREKKYQFAPCDLASLTREVVEMYRPHLEATGFTLRCDAAAAPVVVRADRDALAQVLVNLLSNAEKYCGEKKEISVKWGPTAPGRVSVQVLDRGMGVPSGCEEKIFEQFYRAQDSLNSGVQGSGLGLTLARQIARAHGGDIVHERRESGGSCFTLWLPQRSEA